MFKKIEIQLTEPLCGCSVANLKWGIPTDSEGKPCLIITCRTCKISMFIPSEKFFANFKLDIPYPGVKSVEKPKEKHTVIDGGKVIPLHKDEEEK